MTYAPLHSKTTSLNQAEYFPEDQSQLIVKITNVYSNIAKAVNVREVAFYDLQPLLTGQQFFNSVDVQKLRPTYRKVFNIGGIATGATLNTAHGLTNVIAFTRIYGTCITAAGFYPLPLVNVLNVTNQVSVSILGANLVIVNGATAAAITSGIVVLEYILG
jgi:hypothetical protein